RLGRPPAGRGRARAVETITQTHPLVRFVAERVADTDAPKLRPAIAATVRTDQLPSPAPVGPGRYAVLATLWRFGGQVDLERIAYAGCSIPDGGAIDDDAAER